MKTLRSITIIACLILCASCGQSEEVKAAREAREATREAQAAAQEAAAQAWEAAAEAWEAAEEAAERKSDAYEQAVIDRPLEEAIETLETRAAAVSALFASEIALNVMDMRELLAVNSEAAEDAREGAAEAREAAAEAREAAAEARRRLRKRGKKNRGNRLPLRGGWL